jgi:K+-transporting ATPase KdpF subunit
MIEEVAFMLLLGILIVALGGYLVYALVNPEKF